MTKHLLVVCTGNICRSPMAEGLLCQRFTEAGWSNQIAIQSAGTFAQVGNPASQPGLALLAQQGIDISGHRAQQVTPILLDWADLILVMTEEHRRSIFYYGMHYLPKVFLLSELSGAHQEIPDPYGQNQDAYVRVLNTIDTFINTGWEILLKRLKIESG